MQGSQFLIIAALKLYRPLLEAARTRPSFLAEEINQMVRKVNNASDRDQSYQA